MPIQTRCDCGRKLNVPDHMAGRKIMCPDCKSPLAVRAAGPEPEPEPVQVEEAVEAAGRGARRPAGARSTQSRRRQGVPTGGRAAASGRRSAVRDLPEVAPGGAKKGILIGGMTGIALLGLMVGGLLLVRREPEDPISPAGPGEDATAKPDAQARQWEWGDLVEEYNESVVLIHSEGGDGSGFVVTKDGLVCTNFHVIAEAFVEKGIEVKVFGKGEDGEPTSTTYTDVVPVFVDGTRDIALLEVRDEGAGPFKPVVLHAADTYRTGEDVAAIGSPGSTAGNVLENTFTKGTISKDRRPALGSEHIQIDVAINRGNSGGPIFNRYGEVIGMATFGYSGKDNLNFAVPARFLRDSVAACPPRGESIEGERARAKSSVEAFWKALKGGESEAVERFVPEYLFERERESFNMVMMQYKYSYVDGYLARLGPVGLMNRLERRASAESRLLAQVIIDRKDEKEPQLKPAEIKKFYVDLQLAIWKEQGYVEFEILAVELKGAMGKFQVKVKSKDEAGKVREAAEWRYIFQDRGQWKYYLNPIEREDLWWY